MDKNLYLKRFSGMNAKGVSLENLAELQKLHMYMIPFENLDVIRKVPIYLNLNRIFEKIVGRHRGGYCYELNGLFHWCLTELGYNAQLLSATVKRPNGIWAKPDTHATILVELDKPYLVDVGFGDSTILPIPLDGEKQTDVSGTYWIENNGSGNFELVRQNEQKNRTLYRFNCSPKILADFHEGIVFNQVSPESSFTHHDVVTMATPSGRITLRDETFTITENGVQQMKELTLDEKQVVLCDSFGLKINIH